MPRIGELRINAFRNLDSVNIRPSPGINLIYGDNGSGKTSLLEAISVLAHGRSFRTHKFRRLINDKQGETTVFALLNDGDDELRVGVSRKRSGEFNIRINGQNVQSASELAKQVPLLVMDAHSFMLLEGSARVRRQFFDWLVFHVKHEFRELWKSYSTCLKHRNSLLRRDKISALELQPWDREFVDLSAAIEVQRQEVLAPFLEAFKNTVKEFGFQHDDLFIAYENGWKGETGSIELLRASFEKDRKQGFSSLGPHKADLKIMIGSVPAVETLSRGQQKLLISTLYLAEAQVKKLENGSEVVFLLDDMPAELDSQHLVQLAGWLNKLDTQLFITGVNAGSLKELWPNIQELDHAVFHVKHGEIHQC